MTCQPLLLTTSLLLALPSLAGGAAAVSPPSAHVSVANVSSYGAVGDGSSDDTAAIRRAIESIGRTGGEVVFPPGVFKTSAPLYLASGVTLRGAGMGATVLRGTARTWVLLGRDIAHFGIRDLTVATDGTDHIEGIELGRATRGIISNVEVRDTTYLGVMLSQSSDIHISNVIIRNIRSTGTDGLIGGTGLHLFDGTTRVTVNGLIVDGTDGSGVWLDAQTSGGVPHPVTDSTFNGLVVRNFGRVIGGSAGFATQGAARCSGSAWVIGPAHEPTERATSGVVLNVDQGGAPTTDCVFSSILIHRVGSAAIRILSGQRNHLSHVRVLDPTGAVVNYAAVFDEGFVASGVPPDNSDNVIDDLSVSTSGQPFTGRYSRSVLFNSASARCFRNRVEQLRPGTPSGAIAFWNGPNAPESGPNANVVSYLASNGAIRHDSGAIRAQRFISTLGPDRGDSDYTLVVGKDSPTQFWATELTSHRRVVLSAEGAVNGDGFRIVRTGRGAFSLDVGGLKTIPASTAAFVDVAFDGTAWRMTGYGTL